MNSWIKIKIQRIVGGISSNSKINNTGDDLVLEDEMSPEGAVRRINSVWAKASSTMVPASVKGIHLSNEKYLDDPNMSIQSVRNITFEQWWKKKEIMQRLKDKLIEDAKMQIYEQMQMKDEFNETKQMQNWKVYSKFLISFFSCLLEFKFSDKFKIIEDWWKSKDKETRIKKKRK